MNNFVLEQQERIRLQFDQFVKTVLYNEFLDYLRIIKAQAEKVTVFTELPAAQLPKLAVWDDHPSDHYHYVVQEDDIIIDDDLLADALDKLSDTNRSIILLAYCLGMSDRMISERLNLARRQVQRLRTRSREELRKRLEMKNNENESE